METKVGQVWTSSSPLYTEDWLGSLKTTRKKSGSFLPKGIRCCARRRWKRRCWTDTIDRHSLQILYGSRFCFVFQQMSLKTEETLQLQRKNSVLTEGRKNMQKKGAEWIRPSLKLFCASCLWFRMFTLWEYDIPICYQPGILDSNLQGERAVPTLQGFCEN